MVSGVYQIKNLVNNKVYVGSSVNVRKRWNRHMKDLRENKHHSVHLQRAWTKYGAQRFSFEILEECSKGELLKIEQDWMNTTKSYDFIYGYNECNIAGSPLGRKQSKETRKKISNKMKGRVVSEETKSKMRGKNNPMFGVKRFDLSERNKLRRGKPTWNKGKCVLSDSQQAEVVNLHTTNKVPMKKLADKYSVSPQTICNIIKRRQNNG